MSENAELDDADRFEETWRPASARDDRDHQLWTGDYLATFALASGARL